MVYMYNVRARASEKKMECDYDYGPLDATNV